MRGLCGRAVASFGEGLINCGEELGLGVADLDEGSSLAVGGHDEDGWGERDAGSAGEFVVGLDGGRQSTLGIDREGQRDSVGGGEALRELLELVEGLNGGLIGEDGVAIIVAEALAFLVEPTGVDSSGGAPNVPGDENIVANPGDAVLGGGLHEQGIGGSAGWALEVTKLDDCHARAGGRMERGGVMDLSCEPWGAELRVGKWRAEEKRAKRQQKEGAKEVIQTGLAGRSLTQKDCATHEGYFNLPDARRWRDQRS